MPRPSWRCLGLAAAIAVTAVPVGCNDPLPLLAPACTLSQSPSACLRCKAQHCAAQVDECHGGGFHQGKSLAEGTADDCRGDAGQIPDDRTTYFSNDPRVAGAYRCGRVSTPGAGVVTKRCTWNPETQAFDKECTYHNGAAPDLGAQPAAACLGFSRCFQTCGCSTDCTASCTGAVSPECSTCLREKVAPCAMQFCAAECADADGGA